MRMPHIPSDSKASPAWIIVAAIPLLVGSLISTLYILFSDNSNKAYSLLFLIPTIGPIIAYVLTESRNRYIASMAGWVFLGQILSVVLLDLILALY